MQKGEYGEALAAQQRALHRSPDAPYTHVHLAITYALLDQQEEATAEVKKALEIDPKISIERISKTLLWKDAAFSKLVVEALHTAGLK